MDINCTVEIVRGCRRGDWDRLAKTVELKPAMHYTIMRRVSLKLPVRMLIFDPALLDLEVAIAKNVVYFHRND